MGASDSFRSCSPGEVYKFFSSKRDLERVADLNSAKVIKTYSNSRGDIVTYFIGSGVCIN